MWLCNSIKKKEKKGSKRWISVPAIKIMVTSMPASHSNKKRERIKIAHVFLRKVLRRE